MTAIMAVLAVAIAIVVAAAIFTGLDVLLALLVEKLHTEIVYYVKPKNLKL